MFIKNNYEECLTNLACSIQKYFEITPKHNSINFIDELLEKKQPKNVVVILFDGLGSRILDRHLQKSDFFLQHKKKEITSVFPATTTAATTSMRTGLHPIEHGWLAWNMYVAPIDETITLFKNCKKGEVGKTCDAFLKEKNKLVHKTIVDEIKEAQKYDAMEISPFSENPYQDLDEMLSMIEKECQKSGKKYIYAYDTEPDYSMHRHGPDHEKITKLIQERNDKVEQLCSHLEDTVVFVIADHGHKAAQHIFLKEYPEIMNLLERTTSLEQRAVSFKVKPNCHEQFVKKFNELFGKDFKLYSKTDVIESHLFGYGKENVFFRDAIGDFLAIAEESNKCILTDGDQALKSQHGGYSDDEIYVPLIIVEC